jgi:hypothetical protein
LREWVRKSADRGAIHKPVDPALSITNRYQRAPITARRSAWVAERSKILPVSQVEKLPVYMVLMDRLINTFPCSAG